MNFGKRKERLRVHKTDQGLKHNRVLVRGNRRNLPGRDDPFTTDIEASSSYPVMRPMKPIGHKKSREKYLTDSEEESLRSHKRSKKKKSDRGRDLKVRTKVEGRRGAGRRSPPRDEFPDDSSEASFSSGSYGSGSFSGGSSISSGESASGKSLSSGSYGSGSFSSGSYGSGSVSGGSSVSSIMSDSRNTAPRMDRPKSRRGGSMFNGITQSEKDEAEKADLLRNFAKLRARGVHITKNFGPKSNLNEMRLEMGRIEHENALQRSIRNNRTALMLGASVITKVTNEYGPSITRGRWAGFDEEIHASINEFDGIFERMGEKYGGVMERLAGGDPVYELVYTLAFKFCQYAVLRFWKRAPAAENLSSEEVKQRYPNIIREAVEEEIRNFRAKQEEDLRRTQFEQRANLAAFESRNFGNQQQQQQYNSYPQAPYVPAGPPVQPQPQQVIRPPSIDFARFYEPQTQEQKAAGIEPSVPQREAAPPPGVRVEAPLERDVRAPADPPVAPSASSDNFGSGTVTVADRTTFIAQDPPSDAYNFDDMHQVLDQMDARYEPDRTHEEEAMAEEEEAYLDELDATDDAYEPERTLDENEDNLDIPVATSLGKTRTSEEKGSKRVITFTKK